MLCAWMAKGFSVASREILDAHGSKHNNYACAWG